MIHWINRMLKELYYRYRYNRLLLFEADPPSRCLQLLERYHRLCRMVSFNKVGYRRRIRYAVSTKTRHIGELLELLETTIKHVEVRLVDSDTLPTRYVDRQRRSVDMWLVDKDQVAYAEDQAMAALLDRSGRLIALFRDLKKNKPSLYAYYNQNMQYVLYDALEALDALLAMQLAVDRVFNITTTTAR